MKSMKDERVISALEGFHRDMRACREGGFFEDGTPPVSAAPALRAGDVLLRLLAQPSSIGIASSMLSGYSHCGVIARRDAGLHVADCYPDDEGGGTREVPLDAWLAGEHDASCFHWLALRHPGLDTSLLPSAVASLAGEYSFRHVADAHAGEFDETARQIGNCSTFLLAVLERAGLPMPGVRALGDVNRGGFLTFLALLKNGFYDVFKAEGASSFLQMASEHGITDMLDWKGRILPPAFAECTPGFEVAAYRRPRREDAKRYTPWLAHHRDRMPALRAAVRCHGLTPDQVPPEIAKAAGPVFERALALQPEGKALDAVLLNRRIMMQEVRDPAAYVRIPLAAGLAFDGLSPSRALAARGVLLAAPALLSLAGNLGWKALAPFTKPCE
jgi:hypothetical protein